jgi:hypothetical protein
MMFLVLEVYQYSSQQEVEFLICLCLFALINPQFSAEGLNLD